MTANNLPAPAAARAAAEKTLARRRRARPRRRQRTRPPRHRNDPGREWCSTVATGAPNCHARRDVHNSTSNTAREHSPERLRPLDGVDPLRPERPPVRRSHSEERTSSPARHSFGAFVRRSAIHTKRTSSIKVMRENANDATRLPRRARGPSPKKQAALDVCG